MNHRIAAVTGRVVPRHPRQRDGSRLSPARHDSDGGGDRRGSGRAIRGAGADGDRRSPFGDATLDRTETQGATVVEQCQQRDLD